MSPLVYNKNVYCTVLLLSLKLPYYYLEDWLEIVKLFLSNKSNSDILRVRERWDTGDVEIICIASLY
jgi:hypothetical protein